MYRKFFKRFFDFLLSLLAIIILFPIMLIVAVLVRFNLGSPVIFKQQRPGKNGKIFNMYKFRSMTEERDQTGKLLPYKQRLTKFGRILRSTSLDELPELFNILNGTMSIIGPRPLLVEYLPYYTEEETHRHDVRPGLTGLAQAKGRSALTWEERFKYDLEYVNKITLWGDIKIIFYTIKSVFKRENTESKGMDNLVDYRKKQGFEPTTVNSEIIKERYI